MELRYGMLVVINTFIKGSGRRYAKCECDCGTIKDIRLDAVKSGRVVSCGCYHKAAVSAAMKTHGQSGHALYKTWSAMLDRCNNEKSKDFHRYGGRGIKVCSSWDSDFLSFALDIGDRPTELHTLDRIDNDGGYSILNCKWSTREEQANNRCDNDRLLPTGVYASGKSFYVQIFKRCKSVHVGTFDNLFDACCCAMGNQGRVVKSEFQY